MKHQVVWGPGKTENFEGHGSFGIAVVRLNPEKGSMVVATFPARHEGEV